MNTVSEFLTEVPETNHVSRECSSAAVLCLRSMVHVMLLTVLNVLYFYITTFQSLCAILNIAKFLDFVLSLYVAHVFSE